MGDNRLVCRAKREDRSEYVDGYYVMLQGIDGPLHLIIDRTGQYIRINPETLGECTGCLDKLGRLIFEGDIICEGNSKKPLIVTYDGQLGRFECYDEKADETWTFLDMNPDLIEIIGNVHEEQMKL